MIKDPPIHLVPKPDKRAFRRPSATSGYVYYAWRTRIWVEGTFALGVMEPWEKYLVCQSFALVRPLVPKPPELTPATIPPSHLVSIFFFVAFLFLTVVIRVLPFYLIPNLYRMAVSSTGTWKWHPTSSHDSSPTSFNSAERQLGPLTMVVGNHSARIPSPPNLICHFLVSWFLTIECSFLSGNR